MVTERVRKLLHLADELGDDERLELADDDVEDGRAELVSRDDAEATIRAAIASAHRRG